MILLFSNRKVDLQRQGPEQFLPCENPIGGEDVLLATAQAAPAGDWLVNLVPSPPKGNGMPADPAVPCWPIWYGA
jgi:hypothetical protein